MKTYLAVAVLALSASLFAQTPKPPPLRLAKRTGAGSTMPTMTSDRPTIHASDPDAVFVEEAKLLSHYGDRIRRRRRGHNFEIS